MAIDSLNNQLNLTTSDDSNNLLAIKRIENKIKQLEIAQEKNKKIIPNHQKEINKFGVEIHKKFSIPIACLFFIFLGLTDKEKD